MDVELKLLEHFRLTNNLSQNFACGFSEDDRIFIITDTGVYILSQNGSVTYECPSFASKKHFIRVSDFSPCANIDLDINSFHNDLRREDLYETLSSLEYSTNLKHAKAIEPAPLFAEWSPRGIVAGNSCVLAILTNLSSLEIYMKALDENEVVQYYLISNICQEIINIEKVKWNYAVRLQTQLKLDEFKKRVNSVAPTALTWSHLLKIHDKQASALFVGHLNGDITIWAIVERDEDPQVESKPCFLGRYHTQLGRITTMYWHETKESEGALLYADSDGKINIIHVSNLDQNEAQFDNEKFLWTEPDTVIIEKITVIIHKNRTYIIVIKQRVLIVYGINENGDFFDCKSIYIDDYYITGIHHFENTIFLLSLTGTFTQVTLSLKNETISLEKKLVPLKYDTVKYRTHGFFFTKNMVLFGVLANPWELQSFSESRANVHILIYYNTSLKPLELLWKNNSETLRDYWDCFEALRLVCLKEKRFPWLGLPSDIDYDKLSLPKLKTLRWIAKLSEMVFNIVPVVENYNIKPYILLHYLVEIKLVVNRIKRLLTLRTTGKELTEFQLQSIFIQNFFLKEMVMKNILSKANVGQTFIEEIVNVMEVANELRYPEPLTCVWCGEKIIGPTCLPPHADSRCSITMMPIFIIPAYKCPHCKALAHKEIENEQNSVHCVYCDIPMEKINCKQKLEELKQVTSDCFKDCLKDTINFEEIEDNDCEYVIFSDSDDDDNQHESLREMYKKFSNCSLQELIKEESI